jgi:hypothetical protein
LELGGDGGGPFAGEADVGGLVADGIGEPEEDQFAAAGAGSGEEGDDAVEVADRLVVELGAAGFEAEVEAEAVGVSDEGGVIVGGAGRDAGPLEVDRFVISSREVPSTPRTSLAPSFLRIASTSAGPSFAPSVLDPGMRKTSLASSRCVANALRFRKGCAPGTLRNGGGADQGSPSSISTP